MRIFITKSRSGHYTLTVRSTRYPEVFAREEKIDTLEAARMQFRRERLVFRVKSREDELDRIGGPLPDYQFHD